MAQRVPMGKIVKQRNEITLHTRSIYIINSRVLMGTTIFRVKFLLIVKLRKIAKVYLEGKVFNHYSMDINLFETSPVLFYIYVSHSNVIIWWGLLLSWLLWWWLLVILWSNWSRGTISSGILWICWNYSWCHNLLSWLILYLWILNWLLNILYRLLNNSLLNYLDLLLYNLLLNHRLLN